MDRAPGLGPGVGAAVMGPVAWVPLSVRTPGRRDGRGQARRMHEKLSREPFLQTRSLTPVAQTGGFQALKRSGTYILGAGSSLVPTPTRPRSIWTFEK